MEIKVLMVDDHEIVRESVRLLLEQETDLTVVDVAGDGRKAIEKVSALAPDVVLMNVGMPGLNGIEATRQIQKQEPDAKVLAFSGYSEKRYVSGMLQAGASGYLLKKTSVSDLMNGIRAVHHGHKHLSPQLIDPLIEDYVDHLMNHPEAPTLTPSEKEVLQLIAEGKSNEEIAAIRNVTAKTIGTHRQHLMDKLGLHSIPELVKYAIREGLTSL